MAPKKITLEPELLNAQISFNLLNNNIDNAEALFKTAQQHITDETILLNLETDLAYYGNQPERLLELDRRNAFLRPSAKTYYNLASSEYLAGNYPAADHALDRAITLHSEYSFALNLKATIAMRVGNLTAAIQYYKKSLSLNPRKSTYTNLGVALTLSGSYNEAINNLELAIKQAPNDPISTLNLADAYNLIGDTKTSKEFYQHVISLTESPEKPSEFRPRAQAFAQIGEGIKALRTLNLAKTKFPNDGKFSYASATVNALSGNYTAALVAVETSIAKGEGKIWYRFPWFKELCKFELFTNKTYPETQPLCKDYL